MTFFSAIPGPADRDDAGRNAGFPPNPADLTPVEVVPNSSRANFPQRQAPGKPINATGRPRVIFRNG
jgi:hypothetical protein